MSSEERLYVMQQKISYHLKNCFWHFTGPDINPRIPHNLLDTSVHHDLIPKTTHYKTEVLHFWLEMGRARRCTRAP